MAPTNKKNKTNGNRDSNKLTPVSKRCLHKHGLGNINKKQSITKYRNKNKQ